ncbi:MAG TPA: DUF2510 domain-containing protein [Mycobacteriales bacterium]|nr:DUF2510 domain-containing protein [Mycobacteriales bacterium]
MSPVFLIVAVVFGFAGYGEARRFARQYGRTPWGWDPWVWAVIMFLSFLIGLVLIAIAERQGRDHPQRPISQQPQLAYAGYGAGVPAAGIDRSAQFGITPAAPAAQWAADPSGRHQYRWWDGSAWTEHVVTNGVSSQDPVSA